MPLEFTKANTGVLIGGVVAHLLSGCGLDRIPGHDDRLNLVTVDATGGVPLVEIGRDALREILGGERRGQGETCGAKTVEIRDGNADLDRLTTDASGIAVAAAGASAPA